jgi:hypothetical protein
MFLFRFNTAREILVLNTGAFRNFMDPCSGAFEHFSHSRIFRNYLSSFGILNKRESNSFLYVSGRFRKRYWRGV